MQIEKVYGPPGCGKTTALLDRLETVLRSGVAPERVAFLTFTVAARKEAVNRVLVRFPFTAAQLPYFKTLHAVAYAQLGLGRGSLVQSEHLQEFAREVNLDFTPVRDNVDTIELIPRLGDKAGDHLLAFDHVRRHREMDVETAMSQLPLEGDLNPWLIRYFTKSYAEWKTREGILDFTDILTRAVTPLDVDVVFIDEAQDLSQLQWTVVQRLMANAQRIFIAGDDDQAIFTWAGASPTGFIEFPGTPTVLEQSYRIPRRVHHVAASLVQMLGSQRFPKVWNPRPVEGRVDFVPEVRDWVPSRDETLILVRNHMFTPEYVAHLRDQGVPYMIGHRPADGLEHVNAIRTWELLRAGRAVTCEMAARALALVPVGDNIDPRVVADLKKSRGDVTRELLMGRARIEDTWDRALLKIDPNDIAYLRRIQAAGRKADEIHVRISTIHAAKGQEATHVVLHTGVTRRVSRSMNHPVHYADEVRVQYVGVTRAKEQLTFVGTEHPWYSPVAVFE